MADTVTVPRKDLLSLSGRLWVLLLFGVGGLVLFGVASCQQANTNHRFDRQQARIEADAERFAQEICKAVNEARADGRRLAQRATLDAGTVLIKVATSGPVSERTQAAIDQYRTGLFEAEARVVADHAAKDHDCAAEARARRRAAGR